MIVQNTDSKIKILMVLGNTGRGGAQTYAMNVLRNIDRKRFQIDFAVNYIDKNGYTEEMRALGSQVYSIPKYRGINLFHYICIFNSVLEKGQYNIVHGHVSSSAFIYLRLAKKHGCSTIVHSHSAGFRGSKIEQFVKKLFTKGAKNPADYWFGCSQLAAERVFGREYRQASKYYDIPNAIIVRDYSFDHKKRESIRKKHCIPFEARVYGHIGSFSEPKNHRFIIEVFEQIYKNQGDEAYLILVGEGKLKSEIEREVQRRNLSKQVIFTGNIGNVNEYLMAMDTLIFPSIFEGFPISLLEAQAAGLYCVSSDSITEEVNLTECIRPLSLSAGPKTWAKVAQDMPEINRQKMNERLLHSKYNMDNSIERLMKLYNEMVHIKG